jgi:site-specific recombinase XerC
MARRLEHEARQLVGKNWKKGSGTNKKLLSNIKGISRFMETQSIQSIRHMKTKHVQKYFDYLKAKGLKASSMQNHATAMRFLAAAIGKKNIVPRTNSELGITRFGRYSPKIADMAKNNNIREKLYSKDERLGVAHDLRQAFGLRAQESITGRIVNRNGQELLRVVGKGGRVRELPIDSPDKQAAISSIKSIMDRQGTPGIIPPDKTLIQFYTIQKNAVHRAGGSKASAANMHSLRHQHSQDMERDGKTLKEIVEDLGHSRESAAGHYIPK